MQPNQFAVEQFAKDRMTETHAAVREQRHARRAGPSSPSVRSTVRRAEILIATLVVALALTVAVLGATSAASGASRSSHMTLRSPATHPTAAAAPSSELLAARFPKHVCV